MDGIQCKCHEKSIDDENFRSNNKKKHFVGVNKNTGRPAGIRDILKCVTKKFVYTLLLTILGNVTYHSCNTIKCVIRQFGSTRAYYIKILLFGKFVSSIIQNITEC